MSLYLRSFVAKQRTTIIWMKRKHLKKKKKKKKKNTPDLKFYLGKLNNDKKIPIW